MWRPTSVLPTRQNCKELKHLSAFRTSYHISDAVLQSRPDHHRQLAPLDGEEESPV
jgi:hypothetical protein